MDSVSLTMAFFSTTYNFGGHQVGNNFVSWFYFHLVATKSITCDVSTQWPTNEKIVISPLNGHHVGSNFALWFYLDLVPIGLIIFYVSTQWPLKEYVFPSLIIFFTWWPPGKKLVISSPSGHQMDTFFSQVLIIPIMTTKLFALLYQNYIHCALFFDTSTWRPPCPSTL